MTTEKDRHTLRQPITPFELEDGRKGFPVNRFDFRFGHQNFNKNSNQLNLLIPGIAIGAKLRYQWLEQAPSNLTQRTKLIFIKGEYTGDLVEEEIPLNKWSPQRNRVPVQLPEFELAVTDKDDIFCAVGKVAIAYLIPFESASIYNADFDTINDVVGVVPDNELRKRHHQAHFEIVQQGSLYTLSPKPTK